MSIGTWVGFPRWYARGRNRAVQYVVVHYTAGSEGPTSAENGAAYDKTRPSSVSTHAFADSNSVAVEVPDADRAYHARDHGNEVGLGLELCGTAQTRAQWLDPISLATLRNGAKWTAEKCLTHGLPVRRLSVAETREAYYGAAGARPRGIVGHIDCTRAYPEDEGDHTDPGPDFPWDVFLAMVREELAALTTPTPVEVPMPLLIVVTDETPKDKICVTDFATRRWLTPEQFHDVTSAPGGPKWSADVPRVTSARADAIYGPDIATLKGAKGDPGPATLAPHTHTVSVTVSGSGSGRSGDAVATA